MYALRTQRLGTKNILQRNPVIYIYINERTVPTRTVYCLTPHSIICTVRQAILFLPIHTAYYIHLAFSMLYNFPSQIFYHATIITIQKVKGFTPV